MGNLYRDRGNFQNAQVAYQKAIELNPGNSITYGSLGDIFNSLEQYEESIAMYQKAIQLDPDDAFSHGSLGGIYKKIGKQDEYEEHISIAKQLIGEDADYNHACLESICGNTDEAITLLKNLIRLGQIDPSWIKQDPDFDFIRQDPRFQELISSY